MISSFCDGIKMKTVQEKNRIKKKKSIDIDQDEIYDCGIN